MLTRTAAVQQFAWALGVGLGWGTGAVEPVRHSAGGAWLSRPAGCRGAAGATVFWAAGKALRRALPGLSAPPP